MCCSVRHSHIGPVCALNPSSLLTNVFWHYSSWTGCRLHGLLLDWSSHLFMYDLVTTTSPVEPVTVPASIKSDTKYFLLECPILECILH